MPQPSDDAIQANETGAALADSRKFAEAVVHYERAVRLAPDWYAPHMNLGIALKHTGDFAGSLARSLRARELDPESAASGALWNAGIAATALGDWQRARWAWKELGIPLPDGEGPIDMNIGTTPIRIAVDDKPEVVWCHRLDPARARIESIPTPESGRRYQDVLLHDGEPRGKRRYGEAVLSVFDELVVLERSPYSTYGVDVVAFTESELDELFRSVAERCESAALEDWTGSLEVLCSKCSEGLPHRHDEEQEPQQPWEPERHVGVATTDDAVFDVIAEWARASSRRRVSSPVLLTPFVH